MTTANERLNKLNDHLINHPNSNTNNSIPLKRQEILKWNGWGYNDTKFSFNRQDHSVSFTNGRYKFSDEKLPYFKDWAEKTLQLDFTQEINKVLFNHDRLPEPRKNDEFLRKLQGLEIKFSFDGEDRLFRSHGHSLHEIFTLRTEGTLERIPDIVVWPKCHEDTVKLIEIAHECNVAVIPFGGGTSVSRGIECPINENRMIVSLDTSQMNKILWIDHLNLTAKIEAGIIGQDLERELKKFKLCVGHEPDSFEFSSLGGWVSTKASGMKKNIYGNIEDLLVNVKLVTPIGTIERKCNVPRISSGPDVQNMIIGSEGIFGVVTEVVIKVRPIPQCKKYGSLVFLCFEDGFHFLREVALKRLKPASLRLMDNQQFIFGQVLRPESGSYMAKVKEYLKKMYITKVKGFKIEKMCVATFVLEGTEQQVDNLGKRLLQLASQYNGLSAGEENGLRGYMLTYVIAYIRDIGLDYGVVSESFETSVPWDRCLDLCNNVKACIEREVKRFNITKPAFFSYRLTQSYDSGVCIYFYFAFNYTERSDWNPLEIYSSIESAARDEIIACGGSISHHHGVGKIRKKWLEDSISSIGVGMIKAIKQYVDPKNIFASGNLLD